MRVLTMNEFVLNWYQPEDLQPAEVCIRNLQTTTWQKIPRLFPYRASPVLELVALRLYQCNLQYRPLSFRGVDTRGPGHVRSSDGHLGDLFGILPPQGGYQGSLDAVFRSILKYFRIPAQKTPWAENFRWKRKKARRAE